MFELVKDQVLKAKLFWQLPHLGYFGLFFTALCCLLLLGLSSSKASGSKFSDEDVLAALSLAYDEHLSQGLLTQLVTEGHKTEAFKLAFEIGDELFEHTFTTLDGVGANVGNGLSFTNIPRADLTAYGEWARHFPARSTGPNAQSCQSCHNQPVGSTSSGSVATNVVRDPLLTGDLSSFITRNTTHMFGSGAVQRLAEEMTENLHALRDQAILAAKSKQEVVVQPLVTKGVSFGAISVAPDGSIDSSKVVGIDTDLVVKPFQWKGSDASLRTFVRDASHGELGMQAVEMVGLNVDGDYDGVVNELSTGDITAMVIYAAAQPRPVTKLELAELGLIEPLTDVEVNQILEGERVFAAVGCNSCHASSMVLNEPVFSEPSKNEAYRDVLTPAGQPVGDLALNVEQAVTFDLTQDQPDNVLFVDGQEVKLGSFETTAQDGAIINLYSDLKRHDMGTRLAESVDEVGTGASVFLTKELWGVADTAPYLHDGRATSLVEAILEHGGEARLVRDRFVALNTPKQEALLAFLNNLKLFLQEE